VQTLACSPRQTITALVFLADGRLLVGSASKAAQMWDGTRGRRLWESRDGHDRAVRSLAADAAGRLVLTAGGSRVWLRDAATGKVKMNAGGTPALPLTHDRTVQTVTATPDGLTVLTGCEDGSAHLWDAAGTEIAELCRKPSGLLTVAFDPVRPNRLFVGDMEGGAWLWTNTLAPPRPRVGTIRLWLEIVTGMEMDARRGTQDLDDRAWEARRKLLKDSGLPLP
jgi:WD40 repeat protein